MASSTRTKAPQKGNRSKSGRRLPPKVKTGPDIPLLPIAVGAILVALSIGLFAYYLINNKSNAPLVAQGIPCDQLEHTQVHYHAALQIIHEGVLTPIPGGIGIQGGEASPTCYYWLHVHSANQDVIHIESPASQTFTLSQFFSVWNAWSTNNGGPTEPISTTQISSFKLQPGEKMYVYVDANDGKGPQLFDGNPGTIVLKAHEVVSVEITSGAATPPPAFNWSSTANAGL
jgi:hypothetical protein